MKVGDRVWVEVSRDKERMGSVSVVQPETSFVVMDDDPELGNQIFNNSRIRPATTELDTTQIHIREPDSFNHLDIGPDSVMYVSELETATKHNAGKIRLELIPPSAIDAMGRAFTYGAEKYADYDWAKGFDWEVLIGSASRHFNDFRKGNDIDEESGLHQLDLLMANIAMLIAHVEEGLGNDNRRKTNS